jgi:hypothetical protein
MLVRLQLKAAQKGKLAKVILRHVSLFKLSRHAGVWASKYVTPRFLTSGTIRMSHYSLPLGLGRCNQGEIAPSTYYAGGGGQTKPGVEKISCTCWWPEPESFLPVQLLFQLSNIFFFNVWNKSLSIFLFYGGVQPGHRLSLLAYFLVSLSPSRQMLG